MNVVIVKLKLYGAALRKRRQADSDDTAKTLDDVGQVMQDAATLLEKYRKA